jgi:3-hydroxybutyryl-CoA dehydrogenase
MFENWKMMVVGGGGTMGSGIALVYALNGFETIVVDQNDEFLARAKSLITKNAEFLVQEKLASRKAADGVHELVTYVKESDLEKVASKVDLVLESIFENADAKRELFAKLDKYCRPDCIFCTNTSASNIFDIAKISHPERLLITHWFNPPFIMGLIEIVMGPDTSESVVEKVKALYVKLGKNPAVIRQYIPGFIVNRLANALMREASYMVSKGWTTPQDIDTAIRETNGVRFAFEGPMALYDIVGWDLVQTVALDLFTSLCNDTEGGYRMAVDMVKNGELGLKSGKGAYDYAGVAPATYMNERSAKILKMYKSIKNLEKVETGER